jgi:hypothetical protein
MIKTIGYIVSEVQWKLWDFSDRKLLQWTQAAIYAYKLLHINYSQEVKVAYLEMNDANIIPFPNDYVAYTKIAVNACGNLWTLSVNNDMVLPRAEKCGRTIREVCRCESDDGVSFDPPEEGIEFAGHWYNGLYNTHLFAAGGGFNKGYYRIDKEKRQFVFDAEMPKLQIILEYTTDGINYTGETIIPELAVDYLVQSVIYEEHRFGNYNGYDKQASKVALDEARNMYNWNLMKPLLSELQDMHWRTRRRVKNPQII